MELWVEKYRPRKKSQLLSQSQHITLLKSFVEKQNFPHLLLYGSPGTGKTSFAKLAAHYFVDILEVLNSCQYNIH